MLIRLLIAVAAMLALPAPATAAWHEAKSRHFIIYADMEADDLLDFATRLERFDQSVRTAIKAGDPPVGNGNRLAIYVMPSEKDVQTLRGDTTGFIRGFYAGRASGSLAYVAKDSADIRKDTIFFHEYTHHLMMQQVELPYPEWYVEGFAEFFSTPEFDKDGSVWLGAPAQHRAYTLFRGEQIPVAVLLGGTYGDLSSLPKEKVEAIYGRSWLLSHYLLLGTKRQGQLTQYVMQVARGVPLAQAAQSAFGDLDQLDRELRSYQSRRLLHFKVPASSIRIEPIQVNPLGKGASEIVLLRGRLKYQDSREAAEQLLPRIRQTQARYPGDELVETTLAEAELLAGHAEAAEAAAVRALTANPRNTEALILKGRAIAARAETADDEQHHALFEQARAAFLAANRIDPEDPEPLVEYYRAFLGEGVRPTANAIAGLHYASVLAPQDLGLRMNSAVAYLNEGKLKEARKTLAPVAYSPHAEEVGAAARKVISLIDAGAEPRSILSAAFSAGKN